VQHGERARGEPERQHVHDRAERMLADQARAAAQPEREAAVRGRVGDRARTVLAARIIPGSVGVLGFQNDLGSLGVQEWVPYVSLPYRRPALSRP